VNPIPSSVVVAVTCSAAAGKNPWLPFGLLFVLAAPAELPTWLIDPPLHHALHQLASPQALYGLGAVFLLLAILDSVADKVPLVERWLVPISSTWRPVAGVAISALIAIVAARGAGEVAADLDPGPAKEIPFIAARSLGLSTHVSLVVATVLLGSVFGVLSTVSKTGTRLLLSLVPVPLLRLTHSFVDDLFAFAVAAAGFVLGSHLLVVVAAVIYLAVGAFTGPVLARLTWIHFRIGRELLRKASRRLGGSDSRAAPAMPPWLGAVLEGDTVPAGSSALPGYVYRSGTLGYCRSGYLVVTKHAVCFAARAFPRSRVLRIPLARLARVGLAETATARMVSLVETGEDGGRRETIVSLFPAEAADIHCALDAMTAAARLERVRVDSESARGSVPGYGQTGRSERYLPPERAGSLRLQATTTIAIAISVGLLTGGLVIPIGAGYAMSPHRRRLVAGLAFTFYLSLSVLGSMGLGWPAAVLYASMANVIALRDLARLALKARIDGLVDRSAFLPVVCGRAWIPGEALLSPADRWRPEDGEPVTDASWRDVLSSLRVAASGATTRTA
jgi:hypothetical protein